ncbi:hypothetical protein PPTG_06742 [Phytophthora nicotianae INRA-310]|uniref:Uncharacterized protein n=1 Tax=Phytophthora nicotianae (strain INRA-310) TaxID=761204 RepID=W2QT67_PHYN3|nr:hypothetical protein PPTG_06742 [Phytophthora nicotianae INRA-310]ETN15475.1 hypothetical protein PPTG_06742 [Phytophthora nicotianae INRA-310]
MPKERARREKSLHQPGSLLCKYPSRCNNERAIKANGGRHWLFDEHRHHQNALQRDRYRRAAAKKKSSCKDASTTRATVSEPGLDQIKRETISQLPDRASSLASCQNPASLKALENKLFSRSDGDESDAMRVDALARSCSPATGNCVGEVDRIASADITQGASFPVQLQHSSYAAPVQHTPLMYVLVQAIPLASSASSQVYPASAPSAGYFTAPQATLNPLVVAHGDARSAEALT